MRLPVSSIPSALLLVLAGCGNGSSAPPPAELTSLIAIPGELRPGETVELRPVFGSGQGRIEPSVGPVVSGGRYRVGPFASGRRYTLTVERGAGTVSQTIDVPLRYRERIANGPATAIDRSRHTAVPLADGRVLLVGGSSPSPLLWATTEVFDPRNGTLVPAGDLSVGRAESPLVAMPDGSVFAFAGENNQSSFLLATRVEQWDPATSSWSVRGNLLSNRIRHTATLLPDGRILIAGGHATGGLLTDRDAEIWVPGIGPTSPANEMLRRRAGHSATRLPDGTVLLVGGYDPTSSSGEVLTSAERFDPATSTFTAVGSMQHARAYHAAVPLSDGRVLCIGGEDTVRGPLTSIELFDPATGTFTPAGNLLDARTEVRAVLLGTGAVLLAGGRIGERAATDRIEIWDPATRQCRRVDARLPGPRSGHSLHLLADGRALLYGGDPGTGFPVGMLAFFE